MKLSNNSGLAAFAFRQYDAEGQLDVVVSARGYWQHRQGSKVVRDETESGFQWEDVYEADPFTSPLLGQTDLTPEKPGTDITYLGDSFATSQDRASWSCAIELGPVEKTLNVSGPRYWRKVQKSAFLSKSETWEQGPPETARSVPVDWRLTHGGPRIRADGPEEDTIDPRNPIGLAQPDTGAPEADYRAAQIVSSDPEHSASPAGFGPIAPFWEDRAQYAGTYDADWQQDRHPLLPRDFDLRFWQCAPPDQVAIPYLRGDETYKLTNLHPDHAIAEGHLPGIDLAVLCEEGEASDWHVLNLDGVHFDWRETDRIVLTWRGRFPLRDAALANLTLERVTLVDPASLADGTAA